MKAIIKKIELKKIINKYYFKITLTDIDGNIFIIDKPLLSDPISFRKQVFGIMSACGSYDLMKLATDRPISKKVIGYYINGLKILENENGEWFSYNLNTNQYTCNKINKKELKSLEDIINQNIFSVSKQEGIIANIESRSGIFSLLFNGQSSSTFFISRQQIYYGFEYPIYMGNPQDIENSRYAAQIYTSFIVSLMKFYGINDLLHFGGNVDKFPIVEVTLNNNKIDLISNPNTGLGFSVNEKYEIINAFDRKNEKLKQLIK